MHLQFTAGIWRSGAGDSSFTDWLITGGYLLTAARAVMATRTSTKLRAGENSARPWWWIAGFALLLGINKQMDFQTMVIEWGRTASRWLGAYEHRGLIKKGFLLVAGIGALSLVAHWIHHYRQFVRRHLLLICGVAIVLVRCGLRAAGMLDSGEETGNPPQRLGLLEGFGVALMLAGACLPRKSSATPGNA